MLEFTVLIENTAEEGLCFEHGLSFWIQFNDKKILLDAGSSDQFLSNAELMHIPVNEADYCVLSHGHYDHSTGFVSYLKANSMKKLHAGRQIEQKYYSASKGPLHSIGVPDELIGELKNQLVFIDEVTEIDKGIYLVPHFKDYSENAEKAKLYKEKDGIMVLDDFKHEISLLFNTEKGLVVFNSCSHAGVQNIIEEITVYFNKPIYAFIGGFHMKGSKNGQEICIYSKDEIERLCNRLSDVQYIYTGHCTGACSYRLLESFLKERLHPLYSGLKVQL